MDSDKNPFPWTKVEIASERVRAWFYRVSVPGMALLVAYGKVEDKTAPLWGAFLVAMLGGSSAAWHTSTKKK